MIYLTLPELLHVAGRTLGLDYAVRDYGLLEAALARPQATAFGKDAYPDLDAKAASLLHSIARNRALIDGNKRLALAAVIAFYGLNGRRLTLTNDQAYDLVMNVAAGQLDTVDAISAILRSDSLDSRAMATITAAARTMYPHDALPDDVYARVSEKLAEAAREDPDAARTIEEGVSELNGGRLFAELPADEKFEILRRIEGSEFFELVRSTAVVEVYSDDRTWQLVGYEGPSFDKGGYINRGFNDLDWLPDPEAPS